MTQIMEAETVEIKKVSRIVSVLKFIKNNPTGIIGLLLVVTTVLCAIFAPYIAPYDPGAASLGHRLDLPKWLDDTGKSQYLLGGDQVGRDLLSRIIYGARISLLVGICGVLISLVLGTFLGIVSGYFGKWMDDLIMRLAEVQLGLPFILLAIVIMSVFGTGIEKIIIILGLTYWVSFARLIRGEILALKEQEYIQAAKAIGGTHFKIILKHILPNVASSILVLATMCIAEFILLEASLTFLGLGVEPTIPSWGGMLADSRNYMTSAWWISVFPGIAIMLTVLGFNLLGDWLRDRLDPNMKV
ncbi:ABC transporter permease [Lysinibacillus capsici]|uniref:ABC transporter permease n=1 Tax=Lysinibacillus capsici TaxID=2115968 RepID=UPI0001DA52AC|nr:ABC transporter permease [Lysinibacillus capsici]EFI69974.1 binding-protein-dependent transport systems inner membrane component [Lysinibacillus fusiformis ZC1]EKU44400.1 binding-protein-dependent transport systems inner membrane component [Lysinibacillus fusiformis ZB2]MED4697442.1 ABC transporter permease [Lysinibacillus capsici]